MDDYFEEKLLSEHDRIQNMVHVYGLDSEGIPPFWKDVFGLQDFRSTALKIWLPRVAVAILIHLVGLYLNNLSQAWLQANISGYYENRWIPNPKYTNHTVKLWDVTFEFLPYFPDTRPADIAAALPMNVAILRFLVFSGPMSLRWTIFCRVLIVWGVMWFLRGVCIVTTPLPNPDFTCAPRITYPDNIFLEAFAIMPFNTHNDLTCQDVMFSGHTVGLTLGGLTVAKYWSRAPWCALDAKEGLYSFTTFIAVVVAIIVIVGMYFIIASHFHYTVDVIVAAVLTCLVFNSYHTAIERCWSKKQECIRIPASNFFRWLELHSKDNMLWRRSARSLYGGVHSSPNGSEQQEETTDDDGEEDDEEFRS